MPNLMHAHGTYSAGFSTSAIYFIPWGSGNDDSNTTITNRILQLFYPNYFTTGDLYLRLVYGSWGPASNPTVPGQGASTFYLHINNAGSATDSALVANLSPSTPATVFMEATGLSLGSQDRFEIGVTTTTRGARWRAYFLVAQDEPF